MSTPAWEGGSGGGGGIKQAFKCLCFPTPQIGAGLSADMNRCNDFGLPYQQWLSVTVVKELRYNCVKADLL